jgi:hypothetical protein
MVIYQRGIHAYDLRRIIFEYCTIVTHGLLCGWNGAKIRGPNGAGIGNIKYGSIATAALVNYHITSGTGWQLVVLYKRGLIQTSVRIVIDALITEIYRYCHLGVRKQNGVITHEHSVICPGKYRDVCGIIFLDSRLLACETVFIDLDGNLVNVVSEAFVSNIPSNYMRGLGGKTKHNQYKKQPAAYVKLKAHILP